MPGHEGFTTTLRRGPALLRNPLTDDRGIERVAHERMAQRLAIQIRVTDPYLPWQRDTNATTHGRLPQYIPQGTDVSDFTQREVNAITHRLNTRPRIWFNFATPREGYPHLRHHALVARGT